MIKISDGDFICIMEALQAAGIWNTPVMLRRVGGKWNDFELDAIQRTGEALRKCEELAACIKLDPDSEVIQISGEALKKMRYICTTTGLTPDGLFHAALHALAEKEASRTTGDHGPPDDAPLPCPWCIQGIDNCTHSQAEIRRKIFEDLPRRKGLQDLLQASNAQQVADLDVTA